MNVRPYEVEFLGKVSQIPDDLWDTCFHPPGEGLWWYQALEQSGMDDQFTLFYGLIKDLGSPVGIAPLFGMDIPRRTSCSAGILAAPAPHGKVRTVCPLQADLICRLSDPG
jgi:hypothetical protein